MTVGVMSNLLRRDQTKIKKNKTNIVFIYIHILVLMNILNLFFLNIFRPINSHHKRENSIFIHKRISEFLTEI